MGKKIVLLVVLSITIASCKSQQTMIDKSVVQEFDIESYLGRWYEIARYDHRFERGLVGVTANYSFRDDGKIKVVNAGFKGSLDGPRSEANGKAKIPDPKVPAKLKVSFFWFFYGDYYVMELDDNYQWALVGSSADTYLWILSRTPQIDDSLYRDLLERLTKRGYDVDKLIKVQQPEN
jgi:lipocalin